MSRPSNLEVVPLERRDVPALFGNPWANADRLTMSFMPDDTVIAGYSQATLGLGQPSRLFSKLDLAGTPEKWQTTLLRAFQTWAVHTNINFGLVTDAGTPGGPDSRKAGAGTTGDIRIGAAYATPDVVAINQPYNLLSGAWSGDVLFNTAQQFSIGSQNGKFDLFTVALHEAGNVLGLADRDADSTSALYGHYVGARTGLNLTDIAALQGLYGGARRPDAYENNNTLAAAHRLSPFSAPTNPTRKMVQALNADLTTLADVDHFVFKTGADTTSLTIRLETVGKSLMAGKITVYDDKNMIVGTATADGPQKMKDLVLTISGVKAGKDYRVRVEKASDDVFGIGKYDLRVGYNFDPGSPPGPAVVVNPLSDAGKNDRLADATTLSAVGGSANKMYVMAGRIESPTDVDFYRLNSPSTITGPMTVLLDPANSYSLYTKVTVFDNNGAVVPSLVAANGIDGRLVVQVMNPNPSKAYYLKVESAPRDGVGATGKYTLTVDFTQAAINLSTVASKTLSSAQTTDYTALSVPETKLFHFTLGATSTDLAATSGVRMIIYSSSGQIVATMTADNGCTISGAIFLVQGTYTIKVEGATRTGEPLTNLTYTLRTAVLSDPIDPYAPADPIIASPPPPPPEYTTGIYTGPPLLDPWLDPWG